MHLIACLIHQQFLWAALRSYTLPINGKYGVTYVNIQSGTGERRGRITVSWITLQDVRYTIAVISGIIAPVYPQETLLVVGSMAILTTYFISM